MKALFIGGTGTISSACAPLAVARGFDLYLLTRGNSTPYSIPEGATVLRGDIRDPDSVKAAIGDMHFDVVVDWVAFGVDHVETDLALFRDRCDQYIFISSASAYQKPPNLPITESTVLSNPFWDYSRAKIACEERLVQAYREEGFPITIVRPSHTYNRTRLPMFGRWTIVDRMRRGLPVIVHGDGTSLWVLTHHRDFAKGFVGLMGNNRAIGEAVHITSDEVLSWNQIFSIIARATGTTANIVHVPSHVINHYDEGWGTSLIGDKAHSVIFDNSKIKRLVPDFAATIPYAQGAKEVIAWFEADPTRQIIDGHANMVIDRILADYQTNWRI